MQCRFKAAMMTITMVPWTSPLRLKAYGRPSTPAPTTEMNRFEAALTDNAIGVCRHSPLVSEVACRV